MSRSVVPSRSSTAPVRVPESADGVAVSVTVRPDTAAVERGRGRHLADGLGPRRRDRAGVEGAGRDVGRGVGVVARVHARQGQRRGAGRQCDGADRVVPSRSSTESGGAPLALVVVADSVTLRPDAEVVRSVVVATRATVTVRTGEAEPTYDDASLGHERGLVGVVARRDEAQGQRRRATRPAAAVPTSVLPSRSSTVPAGAPPSVADLHGERHVAAGRGGGQRGGGGDLDRRPSGSARSSRRASCRTARTSRCRSGRPVRPTSASAPTTPVPPARCRRRSSPRGRPRPRSSVPFVVDGAADSVTVRPLAVASRLVLVAVACTVAVCTAEVEPAYDVGLAGTNVAVQLWLPVLTSGRTAEAVPDDRVRVATSVVPSRNSTVPAGRARDAGDGRAQRDLVEGDRRPEGGRGGRRRDVGDPLARRRRPAQVVGRGEGRGRRCACRPVRR